MAAQVAIEAGFRDPGFDVPKLARELSVSVRTVHNTFTRFGSTPRREIERRRVSEVDRMPGPRCSPHQRSPNSWASPQPSR
ncbi:hypothetical protein AB0O14_10840 [Microbacterium foliorum]